MKRFTPINHGACINARRTHETFRLEKSSASFPIGKPGVNAPWLVPRGPISNHGPQADLLHASTLQRENVTMKRTSGLPESLPVEDYSRAIRQAVAWLGDRYLLALPIRPHPRQSRRPHYFADATSWIGRSSGSR